MLPPDISPPALPSSKSRVSHLVSSPQFLWLETWLDEQVGQVPSAKCESIKWPLTWLEKQDWQVRYVSSQLRTGLVVLSRCFIASLACLGTWGGWPGTGWPRLASLFSGKSQSQAGSTCKGWDSLITTSLITNQWSPHGWIHACHDLAKSHTPCFANCFCTTQASPLFFISRKEFLPDNSLMIVALVHNYWNCKWWSLYLLSLGSWSPWLVTSDQSSKLWILSLGNLFFYCSLWSWVV